MDRWDWIYLDILYRLMDCGRLSDRECAAEQVAYGILRA